MVRMCLIGGSPVSSFRIERHWPQRLRRNQATCGWPQHEARCPPGSGPRRIRFPEVGRWLRAMLRRFSGAAVRRPRSELPVRAGDPSSHASAGWPACGRNPVPPRPPGRDGLVFAVIPRPCGRFRRIRSRARSWRGGGHREPGEDSCRERWTVPEAPRGREGRGWPVPEDRAGRVDVRARTRASRGDARGNHWNDWRGCSRGLFVQASRGCSRMEFSRWRLLTRLRSASRFRRACSSSAKSSPNRTSRRLLRMTKRYAAA